MPVLPIIDLLIFLGWTTLAIGGVLKAIYIATSYRPTIVGLAPSDLILVAFSFLLLALTLAARTWVRLNEPAVPANRRVPSQRANESYAGAGYRAVGGNGEPVDDAVAAAQGDSLAAGSGTARAAGGTLGR